MPKRVKNGFLKPHLVFTEIKTHLGVDDRIPRNIKDLESIRKIIHEEINAFQKQGRITPHQSKYIQEIVDPLLEDYQKHFPDKSLRDTLIFIRNLAQVRVYQERFDKGCFPEMIMDQSTSIIILMGSKSSIRIW